MVHNNCYFKRCPVYTGGKAYWSLGNDVLRFDIEKGVADLIEFPASGNTYCTYHLLDSNYTEIGVCDGELSYSKITIDEDIEIWLLRGKNDEFEWVKKHTVSLQRIIEMNWDIMSKECENVPGMQQKTAAKDLVKYRVVKPLPFSGGEVVWFSISDWNDEFAKVFKKEVASLMNNVKLKAMTDEAELSELRVDGIISSLQLQARMDWPPN
ncbi:hypothetical protein Syun_015282 [Stephania yunnanensis]|uniref:F-box associated domain-containing protein n=1 Tax=Stephania yunnanensis TaxID=152371 RepID=A0AAP0P9K2_9MAGN